MYVTDSLFYLQHIMGGGENDDNRQIFNLKFRDLMGKLESIDKVKEEDPDDIIERMINKSINM